MKEVLIYKSISDLKPTGGPNGYLYNLYDGLSKIDNQDIHISFLPVYENSIWKSKLKTFIKKRSKLYGIILKIYMFFYIIKIIMNNGKSSTIDFFQYDIVHFHNTCEYYMCRNCLKNYSGKTIITSHSPMPNHQEIICSLGIKNKKIKQYLGNKLKCIDVFAFNNADYIHFPCKEAEECYIKQWNQYNEIHKKNKDKYIYLETGLIPIIDYNQENLREKYKIGKNDYVICYVGRHNEVKGYDSLKRLGNTYLNNNPNAKFLIAGQESPLKGLTNDRWVEIGWTNKPYEIIKASDVFILPNKETYFDLILLEVMSIGKPVVLTRTGGNKYFEKFKDSGLYFYDYDNEEQFISILNNLSQKNLEQIGKKIKQYFKKILPKKYLQ